MAPLRAGGGSPDAEGRPKSYGSTTPWPMREPGADQRRPRRRRRGASRSAGGRGRGCSARSSSEPSIAVPSSSSGGRLEGREVEAGVDRVAQLARQVGAQPPQRAGAGADRPRGRRRVGAPVRVLAAPALIQGQGERVDVGLGPGRTALRLLGGHVGEGADDVAGRGQGGAVGEAGDAEVHQLGARLPLGDLDVLRLDVAVDDAAGVGVVERLAEVGADLADLAVAQLAFAGEAGQGRAVDQLGDQQRVAVLLAHLVQGHDAGMVEARRGLRLAQHPLARLSPRLDRLDRDGPLEAAVPGLVDDAEPAAADAALDQEAVEHQGADQSTGQLRR